MLETSHPPNYYFPPDDVLARRARAPATGCVVLRVEGAGALLHGARRRLGSTARSRVGRTTQPSEAFAPIAGYVAFYAGRMDACFVDDERVVPQPGGFYGGWITRARSSVRSRAAPGPAVW